MADDSSKDKPEHVNTQDQLGGGIGSRRGTPGSSRVVEANPNGNREERRMAAKIAKTQRG